MELFSTARQSPTVSFKEALFRGLPPDNGLYLPVQLPTLSEDFIKNLGTYTFNEIALEISNALLADEISRTELGSIIASAFDFDAPTYRLDQSTYLLELFHGPTLAFKDFGARFMSRVMGHFLEKDQKEITILVATSGDTGGAVGHGFHNVPGVNVVILYPKGKISDIQESQLTTVGGNVSAISVDGAFDDCQALVKKAFLDPELKDCNLSSANSINISRLIPQSFYYFKAVGDLAREGITDPVAFSVPSGNLGNLCGGLLAYQMGLPVKKFISATNANDTFPAYIHSGEYRPKPSVMTLSNAMDVGAPSNFARIASWFTAEDLTKLIEGYSFTDEETLQQIRDVYFSRNYTMCPHTAVGYAGLKTYQKQHSGPGVILSTAHPAKFGDAIIQSIQKEPELPRSLAEVALRKKSYLSIDNSFDNLKEYLLG